MKVLITTQPGLGHLHPLVPLARELERAGHDLAFACAPTFAGQITPLGFRCFPAGLDWLESEAADAFPELRQIPVEKLPWDWFLTEVFADVAALRMAPDLLAICQKWQPDVILRNDFEFASCAIAERLGLPYATVGVETFLPVSAWEHLIGDQLGYLRSVCGLEPYPVADMLYRYLYFSGMPPGFESPALAAEPVAHPLRPVLHDRLSDEALPAWVAGLPDRPTVYVTLGTVFNRLPHIFQTIMAGLEDEPVNVIVTVGRNQDPAAFHPLPGNVHLERYIPLSLLLPYCDLAITHGGYQTIVSVLYHGLPALTIPISATDPIRAYRCMASGMGLAILPDHLRAWANSQGSWAGQQLSALDQWLSLTPESVRDAVRRLLKDSSYSQRARQLSQEMQALPGPDEAVALLARLAEDDTSNRRPRPALNTVM